MKSTSEQLNIMTFDVEEWFHILDLPNPPDRSKWTKLASRAQIGLDLFLEALEESNTTCTFFVLGWLAEKDPNLVKKICSSHHEVASHGYSHELISKQCPVDFRDDLRRSKRIIENISGWETIGYRGPGFSITEKNMWAFDIILKEGFKYDSTLYPGRHGHGGIPGCPSVPFKISTRGGLLEEFPVPVVSIGGVGTAFSGGGYFRLFPAFFINKLINLYNRKGRPVVSYFHPRDFDTDVPRISMPINRRLKCYINLSHTLKKLKKMLSNHKFVSISHWRSTNQALMATVDMKKEIRI
jgi:polysaccharide deacetylase family protein (PEP-CTERM system associated)